MVAVVAVAKGSQRLRRSNDSENNSFLDLSRFARFETGPLSPADCSARSEPGLKLQPIQRGAAVEQRVWAVPVADYTLQRSPAVEFGGGGLEIATQAEPAIKYACPPHACVNAP